MREAPKKTTICEKDAVCNSIPKKDHWRRVCKQTEDSQISAERDFFVSNSKEAIIVAVAAAATQIPD